MASPSGYEKTAWEDRFNRPTVSKLRRGLSAVAAALFDTLRGGLLAQDGVTEDFAWRGACWRWTIEYRTRLSDEPLAVLVPSPADLQVAVPLERDFVQSLSTRRMKRAIRDGLDLAQEPFDTRWGVWSIQGSGMVEDVMDLVEQKLRELARQAG